MIEISQTDLENGFVAPTYFERTEKIRERIVDCTREELIDLAFFQLQMLERFQGNCERINQELEEHLGYYEPLKR
jgi:hypothetical protein